MLVFYVNNTAFVIVECRFCYTFLEQHSFSFVFSSCCFVALGNKIFNTLCGIRLPLLPVSILYAFSTYLGYLYFTANQDPVLLSLSDLMFTINMHLFFSVSCSTLCTAFPLMFGLGLSVILLLCILS